MGEKKIAPGQVQKYPGQRRVGLLFTAGQKYDRVVSGQGPSLHFRLHLVMFLPKTSSKIAGYRNLYNPEMT